MSLLDIDSIQCPQNLRREVRRWPAADLGRAELAVITTELPLTGVFEATGAILDGKVRGWTAVCVG